MYNGLAKILPHPKDYSFLHSQRSFGALIPDPEGLPADFSIYDGRSIPDQDMLDTRFTPPLKQLHFGCTGETGAFESGLQDGELYDPEDLYDNTRPYVSTTGRDMRDMLDTLRNRGPRKADGTFGPKRTAYFNVYGAGKITDADAARIALWINQSEKRGVYVGSYWYSEFARKDAKGSLPIPSFKTQYAPLHAHLVVGWRTLPDGTVELQDLSWQGDDYGVCWIPSVLYNALLAQPFTGAFTTTKQTSGTPIPIGYRAVIDHLIYFVRELFRPLI